LGRKELTGGVGLSVRGESGIGYRFGNGQMGHGLILLLGRIVSPGSNFPFLFCFLLFLFWFLYSFVSFAKSFKSTQPTFRNFLKFKVSKWDSKKKGFKIK
jgi:hypothetical protein